MNLPPRVSISAVVPALNEAENVEKLYTDLSSVLEATGRSYEIVFVDDGSGDETFGLVRKFAAGDDRVRGIRMRKNVGKATALAAGFEAARGEVVITLDGDNQDDPREIPRFLEQIDAGFDVVSGWKKVRNDPGSRVRASKLFNGAIRWISGLDLHDFNCGFKAYRSEVVKSVPLYGERHRFIPVYASDMGFRVTEIEVTHHARKYGKSRYGWERYFRGLADTLSLVVTSRYADRPGHFFYGAGLIYGLFMVLLLYVLPWILTTASFKPNALLSWASFLIPTFGVLIPFILTGLLAELFVSKHPPERHRTAVAERVGFETES